ncbi:MAG: transporter substrate-binding domain-containing protein [Deltaproteobacteria bacterium]|jgi:polar amino acid transport system substrate-binding protein|nr:transporter substrate-binding domain-containing protein [Deltaproteobacteria bacterium]
MKFAKVLLVMILTLIFFSGCARMQQTTSGTSASPVLDRIQKRGELIVGTMGNMPPLNMTSKDGEIFGLEPDLARLLANAMDVKVKFVTRPFNELLPALQTGEVDMVLSGMTITPERNRKVAFIGPYFISGKAFLTKIKTIAYADEAADVNNPNTKIVALKGSTSQAFAEAALDKTTLFTTGTYDEAVDMVLQDKVHAMIADYPICIVSVFRYPEAGLLSVVTQLTYEPIGIAIPANDPLLMNWTRNTLNNIEGSGTLDELKLKWFAEGDWMNKLK